MTPIFLENKNAIPWHWDKLAAYTFPKTMMHFPEQWVTQTRPADPETNHRKRRTKKRKAPDETETHENITIDGQELNIPAVTMMEEIDSSQMSTSHEDQDLRHALDIVSNLQSAGLIPSSVQAPKADTKIRTFIAPPVNNEARACQAPILLNIQTLISRLPYQQMLNQMFTDETDSSKIIPVVTRVYEESFMREPMYEYERKCVCGDACEFNFIDANVPFVGVEFLLNSDSQPVEPQMCVLCSRRTTQEMFYNMVYNGHRFRGFIQRYGNLCQQPGEYAREAMLICPANAAIHNMPLPIVAHHRHRYTVYLQNGTRHVRQHNVYYEDFHQPSSSLVPLLH
jgi:hypothetical protein